jgi:hypothetical protein
MRPIPCIRCLAGAIAALGFFVILTAGASPQEPKKKDPKTVPGNIKLLPGYEHAPQKSIDSRLGQFVWPGGLTIEYGVGYLSDKLAETYKDKALWWREQLIGDLKVNVVFVDGRRLMVTTTQVTTKKIYFKANFEAKVASDRDVAEFFLTILTAAPDKKVDRAALPEPEKTDVPRGIKLLPGYEHIARKTKDTRDGHFKQAGGMAIEYSMGGFSLNFAKSNEGKAVWSREQTIGDFHVHALLLDPKDLIVTLTKESQRDEKRASSRANFRATVASEQDIADFFLMALTCSADKK